ncbi:MAG TPA: hypothetical protein VFH31_01670 [Pyrinomonadaceae bacterium]|nr:hypothetical protein [Pyrinomonadaceae bacterium]
MARPFGRVLFAAILCLLVAGMTTSVLGQGKGRGGGGGGGRGSGGGHGAGHGGPPPGVGVDRGKGNASEKSKGRSDEGLANASEKSKGRSAAGLERARTASNNLRNADRELRDHPGIARTLKTNANDLRSDYQAALAVNPDLKFGHFVSATRVSQNLSRRNPNITRTAILNGLASGRSLGQTLQDLGLSEHDSNEARKQAEREIKRGKKN